MRLNPRCCAGAQGMVQGEELLQAYASADVFMMPSESETLGFVVLEVSHIIQRFFVIQMKLTFPGNQFVQEVLTCPSNVRYRV